MNKLKQLFKKKKKGVVHILQRWAPAESQSFYMIKAQLKYDWKPKQPGSDCANETNWDTYEQNQAWAEVFIIIYI